MTEWFTECGVRFTSQAQVTGLGLFVGGMGLVAAVGTVALAAFSVHTMRRAISQRDLVRAGLSVLLLAAMFAALGLAWMTLSESACYLGVTR